MTVTRFPSHVFGSALELEGPVHERGALSVHPARHVETGARLMIKCLAPDHPDHFRARDFFENEAAVLQSVAHRNLVPLFIRIDTPRAEGLVMPALKGITVRQFLERGRPSRRAAVHVVRQVIEGLTYLHDAGVTHGDLAPENMIFSTYSGRVRLLDFEAASHPLKLVMEDEPIPTRTLGYAAPEQIHAPGGGRAADIYAAGVLLYELLTGEPAFPGVEPARVVERQLDAAYTPPRTIDPDLPARFEALFRTCLAPYPDERFASAAAMGEALVGACRGRDDFDTGRSTFREAASDEDNAYVNVFAR